MVVNKADLLETAEQREQVRTFVETGARGVLGLTPPVLLISARGEQRGGDAGFAALRSLLQARLSETERTRLKLLSPLNTASQLLSGEVTRADAARATLSDDLRVLGDLEAQRATHGETMLGELDGQLNRVSRLLSEFEVRADRFIDARLRFSNLRGLLNSRELEEDFRREAVADLPEAIDRQFGTMIDRFVEANLHFWEDVQAFLIRRQPSQEVARTRFSYDRAALLDGIAGSAREHLATTTEQELARNLSRDAEDAMKGVIGGLAGGVGIGAGIGALVGASALDFTGGILAGLTLGSLGLFVLPNKRIQAHRQLRSRVAELREALERIVRREFEREQDRADTRLHDAISPFTRFTRQEQARLDAARTRSGSCAPNWTPCRARSRRWGNRPGCAARGDSARADDAAACTPGPRLPWGMRQNISSGSPWEAKIGYARAVKVGNVVHVSGTTATVNGEVVGEGDPAEQTRAVLGIIRRALETAGARLEDVVRTRIYVTDIRQWEEIGLAHGEVFGEVRPATTMVQVAALIDPLHLVEIEAEAILPDGQPGWAARAGRGTLERMTEGALDELRRLDDRLRAALRADALLARGGVRQRAAGPRRPVQRPGVLGVPDARRGGGRRRLATRAPRPLLVLTTEFGGAVAVLPGLRRVELHVAPAARLPEVETWTPQHVRPEAMCAGMRTGS